MNKERIERYCKEGKKEKGSKKEMMKTNRGE
jgi:hypothetical protein